jgi:hypothetical protein
MNENSLPTISGSGTQSTTQNPQSAGNSAGSGASASSVQPGTAPAALDIQTSGVPLTNKGLTTIALPQTSGAVAQTAPPARANSPLMTGVSVLFFLLAIAIVAAILLPAKNTTK